ncbi:hypothetical protein CYMTET_38941, partial [Cymbomonas tetramitiformis]
LSSAVVNARACGRGNGHICGRRTSRRGRHGDASGAAAAWQQQNYWRHCQQPGGRSSGAEGICGGGWGVRGGWRKGGGQGRGPRAVAGSAQCCEYPGSGERRSILGQCCGGDWNWSCRSCSKRDHLRTGGRGEYHQGTAQHRFQSARVGKRSKPERVGWQHL